MTKVLSEYFMILFKQKIMTVQEKLAKFVADKLNNTGWSGYDVEEKAKRAGLSITQSYVNRIKNGKAGNISAPKQRALAVGLEVDPQEIYDIVNSIKPREPETFDEEVLKVIKKAGNLEDEQKAELLRIVKLVVAGMQAETRNRPQTKFNPQGIAKEDFEFESVKIKKEKSA